MNRRSDRALDYARVEPHGASAGRVALAFGISAVVVVGISATVLFATVGSYYPVLNALALNSLLVVPILCLSALISSVRGLVYPSRYRARAVAGLVLMVTATFGAFALIGAIAFGYR